MKCRLKSINYYDKDWCKTKYPRILKEFKVTEEFLIDGYGHEVNEVYIEIKTLDDLFKLNKLVPALILRNNEIVIYDSYDD